VHRMRERTASAPDGHPVHGWVTTPPGPGPHPVLLTIHGGPFAQYGWSLFDETQVYVSAGYAVVQCNPRGSSGYGSAHGRAIRGGFGELDAADVLAFLDAALEDPDLDGDRVGIMGGSYGGYLTTLLIGRTSRFAAAISERAFLDPVSFVGSSDIGWTFPDQYLGTDPDRLAAQSAMTNAGSITTPTLVIHSEEDWRCPVEQGARLYVELKRRGVPSELLLFPGEGHELSRSGRPKHRLARFEHVLRWWARWLPTPENPGAGSAELVESDATESAALAAGENGHGAMEPDRAEPLTVRATRVD
jgi:dipeptidyl aminopeptidase/acylaminoacyl peptidase